MISAILFIIAVVLFVVFAPFGLIAQFVLLFFKDKRERYDNPFNFLLGLAFTIDILGNVCCGDLFNMIMLRKGQDVYLFGRGGETISSALGKNLKGVYVWRYKFINIRIFSFHRTIQLTYKYSPKLTKAGNRIANILDTIDPNHCINSIQQTNQ